MSVGWFVTNAVSAVLLPPLDLVLPCLAGLWLRRHRPRLGLSLSLGALALLVAFSTMAGARLLIAPLENMSPPLDLADTHDAGAIVVLGGGRNRAAPEYGGADQPSRDTLMRLRYGAWLYRQIGLPLLVTGGSPEGSQISEAAIMAATMRDDFAIPVRWKEESSDNTAQNAHLSAAMVRKAGVKKIVLVTDAMHMPRAVAAFRATGLDVLAAPTDYRSAAPLAPIDFIPTARALAATHYALHEWIGMLWYRLRGEAAKHG